MTLAQHQCRTELVSDANGNVSLLLNAANGTEAARYEYGPFGELLRTSSSTALLNPIRFSSKYTDDEIETLYYGSRYYGSGTGRWLNRDPIEEFDTPNIYLFVYNSPISYVDAFGLFGPSGHRKIIEQWLDASYIAKRACCCPTLIGVREILIVGSEEFDGATGLQTRYANQHAMRKPGQSVQQAQTEWAKFISNSVNEARRLASAASIAKPPFRCSGVENALGSLAKAIHAYTDSFSPKHKGFQVWRGPEYVFLPGYVARGIKHALGETDDTIGPEVAESVRDTFQSHLDFILCPK